MMATKYIIKIIVDLALLLTVAIPILLFFLLGKPYERGFYCDDESLRYPYKDSTVSTLVLYFVGMFLPAMSMFILEWMRIRHETVGKRVLPPCSAQYNSWLWASYTTIGTFLFGCACSQLATDIAKYSIGRLRPHFIDICKPDWDKMNCTAGYVEHIPCTSTDEHRLKESRLSFPSGHASFSAFTMIYLVIYLQIRYRFQGPKLVRPFVQFVCLMMTFYTTLSRVSDYKHHWSDVLFGFLLGTSVAILISYGVSDLFQPRVQTKAVMGQTVFLQDRHVFDSETENNTVRTNVDN